MKSNVQGVVGDTHDASDPGTRSPGNHHKKGRPAAFCDMLSVTYPAAIAFMMDVRVFYRRISLTTQ